MKKIGIICEYNPFHNGHIYHLERIKDMFPDSLITLVLSSSFTERGDVSFLSKWDKTRIALKYGVDLVIELPFPFATSAADIFSEYAVTILEKLKMEYLVFGSETNDIEVFKNLARCMLYNKEYDILVKKFLDLGNSYPASVSKALYDLTGTKLIYSNDTLAISYIKTILTNNYNIKPLTIKRTNDYAGTTLTSLISSATSIRKAYLENIDIASYVPKETLDSLHIPINYLDNYFYLLKYKLITEINDLEKYNDVKEGIDKRIKKVIFKVNSYQELIDKVKTKRYTYTRLNRMFLHILINFQKNPLDYELNYLRVLGFTNKGREYLKEIKDKLDIQIVTNYKDIDDEVLKLEFKSTIIYLQIIKREDKIQEELKSVPIRLDD